MKDSAQSRYIAGTADREQFLETARRCASLTLPYLLTEEGHTAGGLFNTPWQSTGSRCVNVLSSKMMLALFPVNTTFFKLLINDAELASIPEVTPQVRSEIDLTLSKMEKMIMDQIAETTDRVQIHAAIKHLVVTGNALLFAGKKALKVFPLDRYIVSRDGNGTVIEICTREMVNRDLLPKEFQKSQLMGEGKDSNSPGEDGPKFGVTAASNKGSMNDAVVYTCMELRDGQHHWHQECDGKVVPGSKSSSPVRTSPWIALTFNHCDGESYGRGRVEEFLADLSSLDKLMKALVEGSAAAAKIVFLVSPSATTKPQSLARASNGAIIQGRPEDVGVVQSNKAADFKTVQEMIGQLTQRLNEAFLVLQVRQSERTTSTEVNATIQELNEQISGIYGNLSSSLLRPYLNRKLAALARTKGVPALPKGLVMPTVIAGIMGVGRGQDRQALMEYVGTIAQAMGPEVLAQYINPAEFLKRLAAASGIESVGLVKDEQQLQQEKEQAQQQQMQQQVMGQMGQLAKSPIAEQMINGQQGEQEPPAASLEG